MSASRARQHAGFSMIELMIAIAILGIVTSQLFLVFGTQKRVYTSNERALEAQEGARLTLDLLAFDTRMAGMMVPEIAAVASLDGDGAGNVDLPDRLCVSDPSFVVVPPTGGTSPELDRQPTDYDGAQVTGLAGQTVQVDSTNIDGSNPADIDFVAPGGGVILSDGQRTHCAGLSAATATSLDMVAGQEPPFAFPALNNVVAVPAIIYEVDTATMLLTRNGVALSTEMEDLQVEYWVDLDGDGLIPPGGGLEFPIHDLVAAGLPANGTALIRRVRLTVISRPALQEEEASLTKQGNNRPAAANRPAGAADGFRRRRLTASVLPRNI